MQQSVPSFIIPFTFTKTVVEGGEKRGKGSWRMERRASSSMAKVNNPVINYIFFSLDPSTNCIFYRFIRDNFIDDANENPICPLLFHSLVEEKIFSRNNRAYYRVAMSIPGRDRSLTRIAFSHTRQMEKKSRNRAGNSNVDPAT